MGRGQGSKGWDSMESEPPASSSISDDSWEMEEGEAQFRDFAEVLPECVFESDAFGRIMYANGRALELFGISSMLQLRGTRIEDMIAPEDRSLVLENYERLLAGEDLHGSEYLLVRPNGTRFPGLLCARQLLVDGAPVGVRGVIVDVTERRRTVDLIAAQRDLAISLSSALSVSEVLEKCLRIAISISDMEYGGAYCIDGLTGRLCFSRETDSMSCALSDEDNERVRTFLLQMSPDCRALYGEAHAILANPGLNKASALLPIRHEGRLVGGIHLMSRNISTIEPWRRRGVEAIVAQVGDVIVRLEAEALVELRARYSDAMARCGETLVEASDVGEAMQRVLQILCDVTGVSRVYIFENFEDERGLCMRQIREAVAHGVAPEIDNEILKSLPYSEGAPVLLEHMSTGRAYSGIVRELENPEREILASQGIVSILHVPIKTHRGWWGFMGFDDCVHERRWTPAVIETLSTVASMVGAAVDRRRAEQGVRDREIRYRAIVEGFDGLIYVSSDSGQVEFMNTRLAQWLGTGAGPEERLGSLRELEAACALDVDVKVQSGETVRWEVQSVRDGRWYFCVATPIRHEDGRVSKQVMGLDVTDRRRAEEEKIRLEAQMQHAQKLESLGVLAGGIAHDFNNLLGSMLGNADLMLLELPPWSPIRTRVENIKRASERASELTDQMLAYSGRGTLVKRRFDLNTVVMEMTQLLGSSISKRAELRYEFGEELPLLEGDGAQIRQVVMNLITNASDAIGESDGVISLRTWRDSEARGDDTAREGSSVTEGVFLEVEDTGCGMDEATQGKIFDPFFTTKFAGRGLGLAAVQGIVRSHGGRISLDSHPGNGTTFRIWLPAASADSAAEVESDLSSDPPPTWHGEGTVLLAEDELAVSEIAKSMLERLGFAVIVTHDGAEARQAYVQNADRITAAVVDVTMPRGGGKSVTEVIRARDPHLPILVVSGYSESDTEREFAGDTLRMRFLKKPFSFEMLMTNLRAVLKCVVQKEGPAID